MFCAPDESTVTAPVLGMSKECSRVSFCDGSFYDDLLVRPLPSLTEHSRIEVHHCRNSSVLSLSSAFLALFRCACVSYFSILVHLFQVYCDFSTHEVHKKGHALFCQKE
jgi:hypothetical protein